MGVVYLAEQTEPIRRRVALKVIKLGMDTRQIVARFDAERQALALMDHPNIARVIDAGVTVDGRPYFVMEYVAGVSITEYCDLRRLSTRARLALLTQVCGAVQHAHQKGVIHRDLKPSNVLVADQDGTPVPKIIDFGIAKATQRALTERTLTEQGQFVGTPEYMSPEQAGAAALDADATTDIYSLGVMLYELLVGALPFDPSALRRAGYAEMRRIIREDEPPKPSTRISKTTSSDVAAHRQTDAASLRRQLTGDLDWITLKAIEKEPARRYASASELAADIGRYLNDEAVLASPPSATYRAKKFVRRHRLVVTAAALVAVAILSALVVSTVLYLREGRARLDAVTAGQQRSLAEAAALREKASAEASAASEAAARRVADDKTQVASEALASAEANLYFNNISLIERELAERNLERVDELLAGSPSRLRNWEWNYLSRISHMEELAFAPQLAGIVAIGSDPDGGRLFTASNSDGVRIAIGDLKTGRVIRTVKLVPSEHLPTEIGGFSAAFSPNGQKFVASFSRGARTAGRQLEFETTVWDVNSGKLLYSLPRSSFTAFAWSPDSRQLATWHVPAEYAAAVSLEAMPAQPVVLRDAETGTEMTTVGVYSVAFSLIFSPDGSKLAVANATSTRSWSVATFDIRAGRQLAAFTTSASRATRSLQWSQDGRYVAGLTSGSSSEDVVHAWDSGTGIELWTLPLASGISLGMNSLAFASRGRYLVVADSGVEALRVVDTLTGQELERLSGSVGAVKGLMTLADGSRVGSFEDGFVRIWDPKPGATERQVLGTPQSPSQDRKTGSIALSHDRQTVGLLWSDATLQIFDAVSGDQRVRWAPRKSEKDRESWVFVLPRVAFDRNATRAIASIATATSLDHGLEHDHVIFDVKTGRELATLRSPLGNAGIPSPALDPTGMWAVVITQQMVRVETGGSTSGLTSKESTIDFWDVGRQVVKRVTLPRTSVRPVTWFPDGRRVAISVFTGGLFEQQVYDFRLGQLVKTLSGLPSPAFANDGVRLAVQSGTKTITIWDSRSWRQLLDIGCPKNPRALAFSPDDSRLAVLSEDSVMTLFDTVNGRRVATLQESFSSLQELLIEGYDPEGLAPTVAFSADGTKVVLTTLTWDKKGALIQIRTWDGTPFKPPVGK